MCTGMPSGTELNERTEGLQWQGWTDKQGLCVEAKGKLERLLWAESCEDGRELSKERELQICV